MTFWKRDEETPIAEAPMSGWKIETALPNGKGATLNGSIYLKDGGDEREYLRYIDAVAHGLRVAGYKPVVTIERKQVTKR